MQLKYTEQKDLNFVLPLIKAEDKAGTIISSTSLINADNIAEFLFRTKQGTTAIPFTIEQDGAPIGVVVLNNISSVKRSCCFAILLVSGEHRDTGAGTKAGFMAMEYAFNRLNLNRVYARTWSNNLNMDGIYQLGGFRLEGVEKQEAFINGEWVDRKLWGCLREEFNWSLKEDLGV